MHHVNCFTLLAAEFILPATASVNNILSW